MPAMPPAASPEPTSLRHAAGAGRPWQVRLLGSVQAQRGDQRITSFGSRSVVALLARLAMFPQRSHAREELIELLWPGVSLSVGRNRLRQTLFTLRQLLEPPGPMPAPVLVADRLGVRVVEGALESDAARFEKAVREGRAEQALALYGGELLPGYYDEWIDDERVRLAALEDRMRERALPLSPAASGTELGQTAPVLQHDAGTIAGTATGVDIGRSSLPVYLTRFFGRDAEGARLRAEVLAHRLVTLLGPGGSGKTRLTVELAAALRDVGSQTELGTRFDFVAFVALANCSTRAQLLDALLAALHLRGAGDAPLDPLVDALAGRRALLVLDNFEQLCGVAEDLIAQLTTLIPSLHVLVTSRRVLGLDGEREFAIEPLAMPSRGTPLREAAISPAVSLFVDRARAVRADFHVSSGNLDALIELVHLLEGMPLAIELAAARVRSMAPAAMCELLRTARSTPDGRSLELLHRSGPRSGADARHASMLAVIDWSWRLLDDSQARLLAALTVFHGGFTARAAQAVCGEAGRLVSLGIDELVAHSLLRAEQASGQADNDSREWRFGIFEAVREFAARQLSEDEARVLRARQREWMGRWARELPPTPSLNEARIETPNLLAALGSALADGRPDEAIRLCLPLRRVFEDVELSAEGLTLLEAAVERCTDAALKSQGHTLLGPLLFNAGRRDDARRHVDAGLAGAPPGSPWRARAIHASARVRWRIERRPDGVAPMLAEAEQLAVQADDTELRASLLALRAFVANGERDAAAGQALHSQALALWQQLGNQHAVNSGRYNLAVSAQVAGRQHEALERLAELEPSARALHDWRRLSQTLNVRGDAQSELRLWDDAVAAFRECIQVAWDGMALHELAYGLWNLPRALAHVRDAERAVELASFVARFWETRFGLLTASDRHDLRRIRRLALCQLDARRYAVLWEKGQQMSLAEAVARALTT